MIAKSLKRERSNRTALKVVRISWLGFILLSVFGCASVRRASQDPVVEANYKADHANYRFYGLVDADSRKEWVPGLAPGEYSRYHVTFYPVRHGERWGVFAEKYFRAYNLTMVERRRGKEMDVYARGIEGAKVGN